LLVCLLTYSMQQSPSWAANRFSASKEIPCVLGTRRFFTAFTRARLLFLSWASSNQSIHLHPTSWRSIWILSSHLRLGLLINYHYTPRNISEKRRSHLHRGGSLKSHVHGCHWRGSWHSSKLCEDSAHRTGNSSRTAPVKKMYSNKTKRQAWSTTQQLLLTNPFLSAVSESRGQQLCQYHNHSQYPFEKLTEMWVFQRIPKRKFGIICNVT